MTICPKPWKRRLLLVPLLICSFMATVGAAQPSGTAAPEATDSLDVEPFVAALADGGVAHGLTLRWRPSGRSWGIQLGAARWADLEDDGGDLRRGDVESIGLDLVGARVLSDDSALLAYAGAGWHRPTNESFGIDEDEGVGPRVGFGWRHGLGDHWSLGADLGIGWFDLEPIDDPVLTAAFSIGYSIGPRLRAPRTPVSLVDAQPAVDGGVAKLSLPKRPKDSLDHVLVAPYLEIENEGSRTYRINGTSLRRDPPLPGRVVLPFEQRFDEGAIIEIQPGDKAWISLGRTPLEGDPTSIHVELSFTDATPVSWTVPLATHPFVYRPPLRAEDLDAGEREHWTLDNWHGLHIQGSFAMDLDVEGYCGSEESLTDLRCENLTGDNSDARAWGKRLFAMAGGTVVACERGFHDRHPDEPDDTRNSETNFIEILSPNGDKFSYAHQQQNTIPVEICQVGAMVDTGQYLGKVGSSGTKKTHLHLDIKRAGTAGLVSVPLRFHDAWFVDGTDRSRTGTWPWRRLEGQGLWEVMGFVPLGCGNGIREEAELCDGPDTGNVTCSDQGFGGGNLGCNDDCTELDTTDCQP